MADTIKTLITGVDQLSPTLETINKNVKGFTEGLESSGLAEVPLKEMIGESTLAQPLIDAVKAAVGFETSMAGVKRSVTFETPQQFQAMSRDILDLSERLPESASGLAAIVTEGAKANVPRAELTGFAADAVKMGIAFDQTAAQSGEMMGKWRSSFEMTQPQVAALSEKINVLGGNNLEKQIATMVTAMGPLGPVAGRASGEIVAMGATLAGVDVPTDVAAKGIKSFMQSITEGGAAKAGAFEALQLDINQLTQGMQQDPSGTIEKVLKAISTVDPGTQSAVITQLFGEESLGAITPLLKNLDVLRSNLAKVGEGVQSAGTIEQEFQANSETTAVALKEMENRVDRLSINIGSMFLPAMNETMAVIGPMISQVAALAAEHPGVIKGVVGAAIAFGVLQVAVIAATTASKLLSSVLGMSPVGIVVRALALAAGLLIANWSTVAPYFQAVWAAIREPVMALWEVFKTVFGWSAIGLVVSNWQPLSAFFVGLWDGIKMLASSAFDVMKTLFSWSPLGLIISNWEPLSAFFSALWGVIQALASPVIGYFQSMFDWSPMDMVSAAWQPVSGFFTGIWEGIKAETAPLMDALTGLFNWSPMDSINEKWAPIKTFFSGLFTDIKPFIDPILNWFGIGSDDKSLLQKATQKLNEFAEERRVDNTGPGGGKGAFLTADAVQVSQLKQQQINQAMGIPATSQLLSAPNLPAPGSLLLQQGTGVGSRLEGELNIRFENAPPGMRTEQMQTNQPGLTISPSVGYRTLGAGAAS
ncbi:phage tail tape measure protein [Pseudomonas viridiflava]|uniref:phage tail tape measure protein n=1 Tax=Pseudomonas viridiflava TaxID=33069 RepID=UPI002EC88286|nr:phage tail tape measure protein [Pseudomonas viridiflava]MEE3974142.1 phage tail tape measure protein [Pseudomonas viridiflava]MEE4018965.1 phage tail tape measure protein [Pseudomonas viridiflava]MEE4047522.1 phage tail tape measure protein [Pseudomonas viridiflava]